MCGYITIIMCGWFLPVQKYMTVTDAGHRFVPLNAPPPPPYLAGWLYQHKTILLTYLLLQLVRSVTVSLLIHQTHVDILQSITQLVVLVTPVMKETRALACGYTYWASGRLEPFSLNTNDHKYCISVLQWMKSSMKTEEYHSCILSQIDGLASAILLLCSRVCYTVKFVLYPLLFCFIIINFFKENPPVVVPMYQQSFMAIKPLSVKTKWSFVLSARWKKHFLWHHIYVSEMFQWTKRMVSYYCQTLCLKSMNI